jgi:hypothetical protein
VIITGPVTAVDEFVRKLNLNPSVSYYDTTHIAHTTEYDVGIPYSTEWYGRTYQPVSSARPLVRS